MARDTAGVVPAMDDHRIIEKTIAATQEVFETMLNLRLVPGVPRMTRSAVSAAPGILSLIGLTGSWAGTGSLACSSKFACRCSTLFLMAEYTAVNEDVLDAIAEVTNMIIGCLKTSLEEDLGPMGLSIPTVIFGRNITSHTAAQLEWIVIPFTCDDDELQVQICLTPNREDGNHQRLWYEARNVSSC